MADGSVNTLGKAGMVTCGVRENFRIIDPLASPACVLDRPDIVAEAAQVFDTGRGKSSSA